MKTASEEVSHTMIEVARITRRHIPGILPLMVALREELGRAISHEDLSSRVRELMGRREGKLCIIVAREGRFPVGYAAGAFCVSPWLKGAMFVIQEVYVSRPFRGGPVLKALMQGMEEFAKSKGATELVIMPSKNKRNLLLLAEEKGFEPTGREVFEMWLGKA